MGSTTNPSSVSFQDELIGVLKRYGYDGRVETISSDSLPRVAEVFVRGESTLARILSFSTTTSNVVVRAKIQLLDDSTRVVETVDLGQITTIWPAADAASASASDFMAETKTTLSKQRLPDTYVERKLAQLYKSRVGRARAPTKTAVLSKKKIGPTVAQYFGKQQQQQRQQQECAEHVLRQVIKAGTRYARLVDSKLVQETLYNNNNNRNNNNNNQQQQANQKTFSPRKNKQTKVQQQRALAAEYLSRDAQLGGRFKRWPCLLLDCDEQPTKENNNVVVTLINGGWLIVDQSVRAGTEARKFVERSTTTTTSSQSGDDDDAAATATDKQFKNNNNRQQSTTVADERIVQRLECLAMGELFSSSPSDDKQPQQQLEVDVQETLRTMKLPPTPAGAKTALMRLGRWTATTTTTDNSQNNRIQFWSQPVLDAAAWYVEYSQNQRQQEQQQQSCRGDAHNATDNNKNAPRLDLTHLPAVSVDAKRVSFRDDAIGVRPRSKTGRRVNEAASKWEILLHIADTSDIYTATSTPPNDNETNKEGQQQKYFLSVLRSAAESRGASRYDLPSGPLHLLPPVVLKQLSLKGLRGNAPADATANRCVTLWAYIDERNGKLLDAGIERTLVAPTIDLSFLEASNLMNAKNGEEEEEELKRKARVVLLVVERSLKRWSKRRIEQSEAARKREDRLSAKESSFALQDDMHDDGRDGFLRSRGHRLVDSAMDLYAFAVAALLRRANAPVPQARGADASRGGRLATSPLRRFIDGEAQRQALAVCANFGRPMTAQECKDAGRKANDARNAIWNVRATKR